MMPSDTRPPMNTAVSNKPLKRCSNVPASSSIANITPASGVLNAAAMPRRHQRG
jgi:hypothetical protein